MARTTRNDESPEGGVPVTDSCYEPKNLLVSSDGTCRMKKHKNKPPFLFLLSYNNIYYYLTYNNLIQHLQVNPTQRCESMTSTTWRDGG